MEKKISVIFGDGIGPEVTKQGTKVLDAIARVYGHRFRYQYLSMGAEAIDKTGDPLPEATIEACLSSDATIVGAVGHPKFDNNPLTTVRPEQGLLRLRKAMGLYANIRPVKSYPSLAHLSALKPSQLDGVDIMIIRELTGGIYFGHKTLSDTGDRATDECVYNRSEIERVAHLAFQYAKQRRGKLTLIDKANVLETSRLWRKTVQEIARQYREVMVDYMFVDNAATKLILQPRQFDVILVENMFGDILSAEASVFGGSIGMLPSAAVGDRHALFEPIHGAYPQAAGKDIANPLGAILSAAMLLDHFGLAEEAGKVRLAVEWTIHNGFVTKDIDPVNFYFTTTIGDMIADLIVDKSPSQLHEENIQLRKSTII